MFDFLQFKIECIIWHASCKFEIIYILRICTKIKKSAISSYVVQTQNFTHCECLIRYKKNEDDLICFIPVVFPVDLYWLYN